jgi:hypothetical protein
MTYIRTYEVHRCYGTGDGCTEEQYLQVWGGMPKFLMCTPIKHLVFY